MKREALYWIVTGLAAAFMLLSSVPDVLQLPQAVSIFRHLGYPPYLLVFIGAAKMLAVATVLAPLHLAAARLKEWAFAGLAIDLTGALYSHLSVGDRAAAWAPAVVGLLLVGASYLAYRLRTDGPRPETARRPAAA